MENQKYVHRSAITGKFVTAEYALKNPHTTVKEKIIIKKK